MHTERTSSELSKIATEPGNLAIKLTTRTTKMYLTLFRFYSLDQRLDILTVTTFNFKAHKAVVGALPWASFLVFPQVLGHCCDGRRTKDIQT